MLQIFSLLDDDTRVIISQLDGVEGSDYINANHIDVRTKSLFHYTYGISILCCEAY